MSESFTEYETNPFDAILAEDIRLEMEKQLPGANSHTLDVLSIISAQKAWEWKLECERCRELEDWEIDEQDNS